MKISKPSKKIAISFVVVLTLSLVMILFDLSRMNIMQSKLDVITKEHNIKTELMEVMRNGLYERQVRLRTILLLIDPFERDAEATNFNAYENNVVAARNKFANMQLNTEEALLFEEIQAAMRVAHQAQLQIIEDSIYHQDKEITAELISKSLSPQEVVMKKVSQMVKLQKDASNKAVMDAENSYNEAKTAIYILGGSALIFGVLVAIIVVRLSEQQVRNVNTVMSELEESRHLLEDRVVERTEELAKLRDEALALNKAKDVFLANMSHELRTPLNIIVGYSELLEEDALEEGNKKIVSDLKKIQHAASHQLTLINSILDISKIEEGQLNVNPVEFDVEALLDEIDESSKPLMSKNENRFSIHCIHGIGMMYSDNIRIRQILLNLLSNSAKFTRQGNVSLNVSKSDGGKYIIFEVNDSGLGIPETYMSDLFEKFTQADSSTTRQYGGTGLGLAISKQLSNILNGDISVTSEEGRGSCFTLTLPVVYEG
ncbi:MAG: ATP-binding protein [Gammaproteobacteria bacterium]|nr:ATP-binding protein [Gammaproteobacteria bacterium]MCW8988089.1 ATP-binding protein [Gammaproteobacteria bacterium]MCW9031660.1 ATP-binding protein [Gammaproteobacteria bacterium]